MRRMMEAVLRRYGTAVLVEHGGVQTAVKAFFQPGDKQDAVTPLGLASQGEFCYIGPADHSIETGDLVIVDGVAYLVQRTNCCRDDKGILYRWAAGRKKGGDDTWASQV